MIIDVGALLLQLSNKEVAQYCLELNLKFVAAIYFDSENNIMTLDRNGRVLKFK